MTDKSYFCTHCGNVVDPSTDICTICGKHRKATNKKFKFICLIIAVSILFVTNMILAGLSVFFGAEIVDDNSNIERNISNTQQIDNYINNELYIVNPYKKTIIRFNTEKLPTWKAVDDENYIMDKKAIEYLNLEAKGYVITTEE